MKYPQTAILLFTKTAIAGQVKTRLVPPLSSQQAAQLALQLQIQTIEKIRQASLATLIIYSYPQCDFSASLTCRKQHGADLGERMYNATQETLLSYDQVVLLGSDCPVMQAGYIDQAIHALQQFDAVIGPAEDGGYVLLALKKTARSLFSNIDWGTEQVLRQTRSALADRHWHWQELETLWDVDRAEDYARYQELAAE
ncbi:MAG: TIGR04282 family arsenosugar biosynthesis glycosyltransferase [gamma proteobacterium symbiont of Bathyaustriella thionipta]|nr:TIGR04282 family arsenosugar biosynthesis glycosyltransferase [gamma proteobacterium symbiont of Bathyaustriella thionipta]